MGEWPSYPSFAQIESNDPNNWGQDIPTDATANTKGSYTSMIASTAFDATSLLVMTCYTYSHTVSFLFDIAVGASSSEQIIIPDVYINGGDSGREQIFMQEFPVDIPAGTRISARTQCSTTGPQNLGLSFRPMRGGFFSFGGSPKITTYGANTSDSGGVSIDPGGTADTKGSWVEITSSCSEVYGLMICTGSESLAPQWTHFLIDIGVGGAGSEVVVIADHLVVSTNVVGLGFTPMHSIWYPARIPAGTRIAARSLSGTTDATDRLLDLTLIAFGESS